MFSSLSKYSPKNLLASQLSLALAQFFDVDPKRVETNLIRDAKVVLNDIEIKERRLGDGGDSYLKVSGSMEQIEFSWVWDSAALIKDVKLTVRGVSVHVSVIQGDEQDAMLSDSNTLENTNLEVIGGDDVAGSKRGATNNEAPADWKAKYMQQIIDHLTLAVTDVTLAIHLDEGSQVVFLQAKDMDLQTLASSEGKTTTALMQMISLASIEVWVEQDDASKKFPILEPFGYKASVTRVSGRRFLDGVLSGLLVEGKSIDDSSRASSTIRVHAGIQQIAGLNSLQQVLLLVGQEDTDGAPSPTENKSQGANASNTTEMKSIFHLPFQSMEVVLENETNLRLAGCNVRYSTDGSELCVECSGGIWVDGTPLSKDSRWILDLVSCKLLLDSLPFQEESGGNSFYSAHSNDDVQTETESTSDDDRPIRLDLSLDTFQKVYCGIQAIMPQCAEAKETMNQYTQHEMPSSSSWSMRSSGSVSFRFTGKSEAWVEVVADSPKLSQSSSASKGSISFECKSTKINSNAGFAIQIPHISTDDDGQLLIEHRISATIDSTDTFKVLQNIANDITDIIGDESSSSGTIPVGISLAGFDVSIGSQISTVHLSGISGTGIEWSIGSLQVNEVENITLDASSLQVTLDAHKTTLFVEGIKRVAYDKVDYLAAPIHGTTFVVEKSDVLSMACKDIHIKYPDQAAAFQSNDSSHKRSLTLPMSLHLTVEHLRAESIATGNVDIVGVDFWVRPTTTAESLMVDLDLKSIKARVKDTIEVSCGNIKTSIEIKSGDVNDSILIPGIALSSASMTVRDVAHLSTIAGHLSKPLDVVEITYGARTAMIKCDKVLFCTKTTSDFTSQSSGAVKNNFPIAVFFEVNRLVTMQEFGPGKPGLCCDGLRIHVTPDETTTKINATCNCIQGRDENQADFSIKGFKMKLCKNMLDGKDEFLGLKEMHCTMNEVSTISIPGKLKLAKPICNPVIQLKNNSIDVKCDSIHVSYIQSGEQAVATDDDPTTTEFAAIPVPFRIAVNQMIIDGPTTEVVCNQFSTQYMGATTTTSKSLHVDIMSVNGEFGTNSFKVNGISVSTKWQAVIEHGNEIVIPYLGSLSFAQVELEALLEFTTSSFSLIEPLSEPKVLFQQGFLVLESTDIHLDVTNAAAVSDSHTDKQSEQLDLGIIRVPIGFNVSRKLRLKTTTSDVYLENFGLDYVPSSSSRKGEVFIHCDRLVESASVSAKKIDLHLHLSFADSPKGAELMNIVFPDYVERASMKVDEITSLFVEGKGRLFRPLQNTTLSYQDGVIATDIQTVQFEVLCLEQSLVLGLKNLNVRIKSDPFDRTIRFTTQSSEITGNGSVSFSAAGFSLISTIVPSTTNKGVLDSKPVVIPSLGYASLVVLDVSEITSLSIQNMGQLKRPVTKLALRFENDVITFGCPALFLQRSTEEKKMPPTKSHQGGPPFELPCKAIISIGAFQVHDISRDKTVLREIQCRSLNLTLEPLKAWAGQPNESIRGPGIGIHAIVSVFRSSEGSTVIDVRGLLVSGLVQLNDLATVSNLTIGIEKVRLAAEFTSSNWSGSMDAGADERGTVIALPFASVPKFDLTLKYSGVLVNINDATIACDEFQGDAKTTTSQIGKHYAGIVKGRLPYLLSKTDLANCNLSDSVGVMAGKLVTHTSVLGATVGVASIDAFGSTIAMGKGSRGASASDGYKFGDFSRGVASSVKHAAKSGAEMRSDDSYQFGDFTSGASSAAAGYASDNKCRLAGASGSAIGMGIGAALLGPVGFIAGSMIGGSAAKSSVAALAGADQKKESYGENRSANRSDAIAQQPHSSQVPDFLSDSNHHVAQVTSQHQYANRVPAQSGDAFHHPAHQPHTQANTRTTHTRAHQASNASNDQQGYRFGDVTRGIVAKGKKAEGRDDKSGYKFGDFTRGLFR